MSNIGLCAITVKLQWKQRGVVSESTYISDISNGAAGAFYGPHENVRLLARRNGSKVGEIYAKVRTLYLL